MTKLICSFITCAGIFYFLGCSSAFPPRVKNEDLGKSIHCKESTTSYDDGADHIMKPTEKKYYVNFITEIYDEGVLIERYDRVKDLREKFPGMNLEDSVLCTDTVRTDTARMDLFVSWLDVPDFSRCFSEISFSGKQKGKTRQLIKTDIPLDQATIGSCTSTVNDMRAPLSESEMTPISAHYYSRKNEELVPCPPHAGIKKMTELYSMVIVVYWQLVPPEEQ